MAIVLDENVWAKQMIDSKSIGNRPSETLLRVARYYLDQGYKAKDVHTKLEAFIISCDLNVSLPKMSDRIDTAIKYAEKHKAVEINSINICKAELDKIDGIDGIQTRRLAFTLLCLSKYCDAVNPKADHWVNTKDNEIMAMANINTSIKRQSMMYRSLRDNGMIQFSKQVDNTNVRVLFGEEGEPELKITDMRNLGYRYLMSRGEPYFECMNCGIVTKYKDGNNRRGQKYCPMCAAKMRMEQNVVAISKYRSQKPRM